MANPNEHDNQSEELLSSQEEKKEDQLSNSEELQSELKSQQEKNLRLLAEMENARKRMQRDKHDTIRFAVENVISEFLSPLDNFENAFSFTQQASEEIQNWAKGFEMILTQFKDILSTHNISPFHAEGLLFDPHQHEVIEIEETEKHPDGTVIQQFACGYKSGEDRILRPAKVKVAKAPKKEEENGEDQKTTREKT